jgi:protocatechuate 3,4-dioxygenase beta subunit
MPKVPGQIKGVRIMHKKPCCDCAILSVVLCTCLICGAHVPSSGNTQSIPIHIDDCVQTLPRHDVSGAVLDKDNRPIAGAEVWLYYAWGRNGVRDRLAGRATTNEQGVFEFKQVLLWEPPVGEADREPPHYVVVARHPAHGIYFTKLFKGDALDGTTIIMRRGILDEDGNSNATRRITVQDPQGNPIAGATVFLHRARLVDPELLEAEGQYRSMRIFQDIGVASAVSNVRGIAEVAMAPSAEFYVYKEGYIRTWIRGSKAVLFKGASVSGTVTYPDGSPAVRAVVQYTYAGRGNKWVWNDFALTDAQGHYTFDHAPAAGFYYSWMMNPESEQEARGIAGVVAQDLRVGSKLLCKAKGFIIKPGDRLEQDLSFEEGVTLAGKVIDVGTSKPVPNMEMQLATVTGQRDIASQYVLVDANGHFKVTVPVGSEVSYHFYRSRSKNIYLMDEEWRRRGGAGPEDFLWDVTEDNLDVKFKVKLVPLQPLTGRVMDVKGMAVPHAIVYMHGDLPYARADHSGDFTLKAAFADRDFDLYVESEDKTQAGLAHLKPGTDWAKIVLAPTQTFTGQVTTPEGQPVRNLAFYLELRLNKDGISRVRCKSTTDQNGTFTAMHLFPNASYHAWWSSNNVETRDYAYGNASINLSALDNTIRFTAKKYLQTMKGIVVDPYGHPIADAVIQVTDDTRGRQSDCQPPHQTDAKGFFEIPHLSPRMVSLTVTAPGFISKQRLIPSDCVDVKIVLREYKEETNRALIRNEHHNIQK